MADPPLPPAIVTGGAQFGDHAQVGVVVGGSVGTLNYSAPLRPPSLHHLRPPVADFTGRATELETLTAALREQATRPGGAVAVRGLGGVGKTELAYAVAARVADAFPDAQLVVDLRGASDRPMSPTEALLAAIRAFRPDEPPSEDVTALTGVYRDCLAGKRVLVLADNARDAPQVRPLIPPAGSALLITSRHRFALPGLVAADLGTLPAVEAEALLRTLCPRLTDAEAAELARLGGYLPLALRISGGLLATSTRPPAGYLAQLGDERTRLAKLRDPDDPVLDVEATFTLTYGALSPDVQFALARFSVFPAPFTLQAAQVLLGDWPLDSAWPDLDAGPAGDLLDTLYRRSLLDYDATAERYSLHDLVRVFAGAHLPDAEALRARHATYYAQVAARAEGRYREGGAGMGDGLALFDADRAQIDAGWAWARAHAGTDAGDRLLVAYTEATVQIGDLRYEKRGARIPQIEAALAAARRTGDPVTEAGMLGNLGVAYQTLGEVRQAIPLHEQQLALARALGDRRREGMALGSLGTAYYA
ncbi:MAG TPA: hypothetical protein VM536_10055, partial [Chloroflexia bacterium]|nr:hypothetical protein [Chloroflexia bacterium]